MISQNHKQTVLVNGIASEFVAVNDRALQYGDGLFETILCADSALYYWPQHYQRLLASAQRLGIRCPSEDTLLQDIRLLIGQQKNDDEQTRDTACAIKLILSRGNSHRGYRYPDKGQSRRIVMLSELADDYSALLSERLTAGKLYICDTRASINPTLAGLKHLNRLENVIAHNEWQNTLKQQYLDGLMCDADQHIIECTMSNIFAVKDDKLLTPDLSSSGVRGVMRDEILRLSSASNIDALETTITLDDLIVMDEVFISNSLIGIRSINTIADSSFVKQDISRTIFDNLINSKQEHVQRID
jgi:4-amino-4-deoxychorismate lyase